MADLYCGTRISMLLRKVNRKDHVLCSFYLQQIDPPNLTYEKITSIVNRLCTSFRFGYLEENQFICLIFIIGLQSPCYAEI
ncbi:unnamed protein product [Hymenolepis diminuta]|uniref:Uncharacterized protein n=1 Tax=Hymenolepis diminuta TaxID=6216 RepID=A0A564XYJ7_HYMDI|nr:unnamed protein product [Hymenolepis diminuta]